MQVVSIISTKGGVGKTTTAANLGGFAADTGLRVLLLDLDVQPTLSSYFTLAERAPAGIYEMLAYNEQRAEQNSHILDFFFASRFGCLCSISCCGFSHDDFSGLGRACRPRNGLNWMVLVSPPERTGKDYDQHAPSTVYPSFAAERGIRRVDRAENTCQRADGA